MTCIKLPEDLLRHVPDMHHVLHVVSEHCRPACLGLAHAACIAGLIVLSGYTS